ncbi:hypothetical protein LXL04_030470 [Taraxacum kok-saghyz]
MAAKSDFAQKLLHDLRIRKERMGVSQSSARDAYRNPGNVQRGSRQTKSLESIGGSKTSNQLQMHGRSPRAPAIKESSQQIVSYAGGGHQRTESMGDFPVAFTYALNGGKLLNVDFSGSGNANTMIDFLHQIGRRSLDVRNTQNQTSLVKHRPSNGGGSVVVPALTATQIKEISKGVHNPYEIIRSRSNGNNVDRHSIDVGKELLKGAKGLEESLRMLVNLQEASEMIGTPQRKNRVTLMEVDQEDENDGSKIVNQNQVALPRFSFDKPSKRSNLGQIQTDGSSKVSIHRRSTSYGAENVKNISNTSSNSEKGRISNVIAKLMGLEEIPGKIDYQSNTHNESRIKRQPKDGVAVAPLKDQKPQLQSHESDKSGDSVAIKQRSDQLPEKQDRRQNFETKEKIQQKRRIAESSVNLQHERVEKKKAIRVMEKSNEIKLVPRNNVQIREPEKKTQKSKQVIKSKESQMQPNSEQNPKPKDHATRKPERTEGNVKEKVVIRKKVDSLMAVRRTESPQKDDVLKKNNGTRTLKNLISPSKHKLSVLKETQRKDEQQLVPKTNIKRSNSKNLEEKIEVTDSVISQVPKCENSQNTIKIDPEKTLEIEVSIKHVDSSKRIKESTRDLSENKPKKLFQSGIVLLTENEKQLKEILIKDQLFLSMAETLFNFNIPVGFLIVDDHNNHHNDEIKLKLDCGYEIVRRKARRQELLTHPYMKQPSIGGTSIRFLDELVKQLYKDLESLRLYGRNTDNEYDEADYLHYMLERDIFNNNPDINSFWDFGWHTTTFTFVEKDEFVNDVERDLLRGLVDEMDLQKIGLDINDFMFVDSTNLRWTWDLEGDGCYMVSSLRKEIDSRILEASPIKTLWCKAVPRKVANSPTRPMEDRMKNAVIVSAFLWTIWWSRNDICFNNSVPNIQNLEFEVKHNSYLWLKIRSKFGRDVLLESWL